MANHIPRRITTSKGEQDTIGPLFCSHRIGGAVHEAVAGLFGRERVVLLDGAMGTQLLAQGLVLGDPAEAWNVAHPDRVRAVHRSYVEAGAELVHTNTFGGTPARLAATGLAGRCAELNAAAVGLAREAGAGWVAGDLGPTGLGAGTDPRVLEAQYAEQARALLAAGADLLAVETMVDVREARAAVRATVGLGVPVMASMTVRRCAGGFEGLAGDPVVPSLGALAELGAAAVGFNCMLVPDEMCALLDQVRTALELPIVCQPNAGQPQRHEGGLSYAVGPEDFGRWVVALANSGADLIGGCCGTTPAHIAAAKRLLGPPRG
jgi:5-methyltetrahydrofolate--homocysteine methyltransferase